MEESEMVYLFLLIMAISIGLGLVACRWRYSHDKKLVTRHIQEKGGTVERFRVRIRPIRSEYEVTYRDKKGDRRFAACIMRLNAIYWSRDELLSDARQPDSNNEAT